MLRFNFLVYEVAESSHLRIFALGAFRLNVPAISPDSVFVPGSHGIPTYTKSEVSSYDVKQINVSLAGELSHLGVRLTSYTYPACVFLEVDKASPTSHYAKKCLAIGGADPGLN